VLTYESIRGVLPPGAISGPFPPNVPGGASHGLYPSLLPHLGESALALAYRWDVSFDDPANRAVAGAPIAVLRCPGSGDAAPPGALAGSDYGSVDVNPFLADIGLIDPAAKFESALPVNGRLRLADVKDGLATTLLLVEAPGANPWASPSTMVSVRTLLPSTGGGRHRGGANVCTCDGVVHFLRAETDLRTVARMATRAGGEMVTPNW
jgi:prepilin-type processing-associated H-X9-DG protein